jgi:hypothetical protein
LAKVAIEGDQCSAFSNRGVKHLFVRRAVELLLADGRHVVPCAAERSAMLRLRFSSSLNLTRP